MVSQTVMVCSVVGLVIYVFRRTSNDAREVTRAALSDNRAVTQRAIMALTGLNPHVIDPTTFGPSGMARADEEKQQAAALAALSAQEQQADSLLREAEAEFLRTQQRVPAASRGTPATLQT